MRRLVFILAAALAVLAISTPVAAKTTTFSSSYDSVETDASCGFAVERHDIGKAMGRAKSDGRVDVTNAGVATITNLANGLSVTQKYQALFKNAATVDNGDGTVTIVQKVVGASTVYGSNGEVLLRTHGPITTRLVLRFTDEGVEFVSQEVIVEHGSHDGFCEALTVAIGPGATA